MPFYKLANGAVSRLEDASLDNTTNPVTFNLPAAEAARYPSGYFLLTVYDADTYDVPDNDPNMEIVFVPAGGRSGVVCSNCQRAQLGTTAHAHALGSTVACYILSKHWDDVYAAIEALQAVGTAHWEGAPTGDIDAANVTFTVPYAPVANTFKLFVDGVLQIPGAGENYVRNDTTLTLSVPPEAGTKLWASCEYVA